MELAARLKHLPLKAYRCYWFGDPAVLLAVSSTLRYFADRGEWEIPKDFASWLFEFCLPPENASGDPSRFVETSQLLSWTFFPFSTSQV
jgi:hypothetical protein